MAQVLGTGICLFTLPVWSVFEKVLCYYLSFLFSPAWGADFFSFPEEQSNFTVLSLGVPLHCCSWWVIAGQETESVG